MAFAHKDFSLIVKRPSYVMISIRVAQKINFFNFDIFQLVRPFFYNLAQCGVKNVQISAHCGGKMYLYKEY